MVPVMADRKSAVVQHRRLGATVNLGVQYAGASPESLIATSGTDGIKPLPPWRCGQGPLAHILSG